MLPNDFWKVIMRDGVGNFYCVTVSSDNSFTSKTKECANFSPYNKELWECGRLLFSIDEPINEQEMGNKVLEYGGDFDYKS